MSSKPNATDLLSLDTQSQVANIIPLNFYLVPTLIFLKKSRKLIGEFNLIKRS